MPNVKKTKQPAVKVEEISPAHSSISGEIYGNPANKEDGDKTQQVDQPTGNPTRPDICKTEVLKVTVAVSHDVPDEPVPNGPTDLELNDKEEVNHETDDAANGDTGTGDTGTDDTGTGDTGTGDTGMGDTGTGDTGTGDTGTGDTEPLLDHKEKASAGISLSKGEDNRRESDEARKTVEC